MTALAMGGYGAFVWGSYGLTTIVVIACIWQARSAHKRTYKRIQSRIKAMEAVE